MAHNPNDYRCPHCGEAPAPLGIGHKPGCPRLEVWDGLGNNETLGRLGEPSPEETLSQELDNDAEASHRDLETSPAVRAETVHHKKHLLERKNDTLSFGFSVANPPAGTELVSTGSIPPGVYDVNLYIRTSATAVNRQNANLLQGDLPVGSVTTDINSVIALHFPRVSIRPGEAIRLVNPVADGAAVYFGTLIVTMTESYGRD